MRKIDTRSFVALLDNINLAGELGAETVWLKSADPVKAMLDFAREHGVEKIIIGRTHQPFWRRLAGQERNRAFPRLTVKTSTLKLSVTRHSRRASHDFLAPQPNP